MKIISLNIWGGTVGDYVLDFFKKNQEVDFFLLQEVYHHADERTDWSGKNHRELFDEISNILSDHRGYFADTQDGWGIAGFVKKSIFVNETGDIFVHRWKNAIVGTDGATLGKNIQYFNVVVNKKHFTVVNFHGLWNGKGKSDTAERLLQSENIVQFLKTIPSPYILCGDFNLLPDTASLKKLEDLGMRNLIKEFGITSTRSSLYKKPLRFADYALVSDGIKVNEFKVLPDEISDHLALYLDCE